MRLGQRGLTLSGPLTAVGDRYLKPRYAPEKGRCSVRKDRALRT